MYKNTNLEKKKLMNKIKKRKLTWIKLIFEPIEIFPQ